MNWALSALSRIGIVVAIAIAFLFGLATSVYLSLRSPEVQVPDVVGNDRFVAENILSNSGLNFRVRATRPTNQVKPDTVLFQLPRAGEVVKSGQTVAVDVSRTTKEGETSETIVTGEKTRTDKAENRNTNELSGNNANDNKPKRNRNTNTNTDTDADTSTFANANGNVNRIPGKGNANNRHGDTNLSGADDSTNNGGVNANSGTSVNNRSTQNANANSNRSTSNQNANRRPSPAGRPSTTPDIDKP